MKLIVFIDENDQHKYKYFSLNKLSNLTDPNFNISTGICMVDSKIQVENKGLGY